MGNTLTVRLPLELMARLKQVARTTGLPVGRVVRQSLEKTLNGEVENPLLQFAGAIKRGPRDASLRKGFSRE